MGQGGGGGWGGGAGGPRRPAHDAVQPAAADRLRVPTGDGRRRRPRDLAGGAPARLHGRARAGAVPAGRDVQSAATAQDRLPEIVTTARVRDEWRSEEHTSELQ